MGKIKVEGGFVGSLFDFRTFQQACDRGQQLQSRCHHVPRTSELDETVLSVILAHWLHYVKNDVIHKTKSTDEDRTMATENLVKFGRMCTRTDRKTYRYSDRNTAPS